MRETRVQSLGREDLLEKETATHSSILVWKISWAEEPGRPQSMGSKRVGHDWATSLSNQFYQGVSFKSSFSLSTFGFPGCSVSKESVCKAGDLGPIPCSGRSPGEGNGNPQRSLVGYSLWVHQQLDTTGLLNHQTLLAFGFFLPSCYSELKTIQVFPYIEVSGSQIKNLFIPVIPNTNEVPKADSQMPLPDSPDILPRQGKIYFCQT